MSQFRYSHTSVPKNTFYFTTSSYKPSPTRELGSISYLRDKLFPYCYFRINDFYDIPQTILMFTIGNEVCQIPDLPEWAKNSTVPMNNVIYESNSKKLESILKTFLEQIIKPRFRDKLLRVEMEFTNKIVMPHLLDDAIRLSKKLTFSASQYIKHYADFQMMKGEHKVAYSLYHQLILHFPDRINSHHIEIYLSALMCAVSCDIVIGEINDDTINNVKYLIQYSPTSYFCLLSTLILFWVLPRVNNPSPAVLLEFLDSQYVDEELKTVVKPYLIEQSIQFESKYVLPLKYYQLALLYKGINQKENYVRCLWNCWCSLKNSNCNFCLAYLMETIVNTLLRENTFPNQPIIDQEWFLSDEIGYLMNFTNIERLPIFASLFAMWDSSHKCYETKFIRASILSYTIKYPLFTGPKNYTGNWPQISQKLFGFTSQNSFYSHSELENDKITMGDEILIKVQIFNEFVDFNVGDCCLLIEGNAQSQTETVSNQKKKQVSFYVKPTSGGYFSILGLKIFWVNNINLKAFFTKDRSKGSNSSMNISTNNLNHDNVSGVNSCGSDGALRFECCEKAPIVFLEKLYIVNEILAGEAVILRFILHVKEIGLASLSLLIDCDDTSNFTLLSPQANLIGGQFYFGEIEPNTDIPVSILYSSTDVNLHSNWLFFSYRSSNSKLARYVSYHSKIRVWENESPISMFPSFFGLDQNLLSVSMKKLDENQFQLTLTNNSIRNNLENVVVEFIPQNDFIKDDLSHNKVHEINEELDEEQEEQFYIIGFKRKVFPKLPPRKSAAFCFGIVSFSRDSFPILKISISDKVFVSDTSVYFGHYQIHEIGMY